MKQRPVKPVKVDTVPTRLTGKVYLQDAKGVRIKGQTPASIEFVLMNNGNWELEEDPTFPKFRGLNRVPVHAIEVVLLGGKIRRVFGLDYRVSLGKGDSFYWRCT